MFLIVADRSRAWCFGCSADRNRAGCDMTINRRWGGNDEDEGGVGNGLMNGP